VKVDIARCFVSVKWWETERVQFCMHNTGYSFSVTTSWHVEWRPELGVKKQLQQEFSKHGAPGRRRD
jgi:hypothetical protein